MKRLLKKPKIKKNQMIITGLAVMIAVAGYLNYSGSQLGESLLGVESASVEDENFALDISAEDMYAESGTEEMGDILSLDESTDVAATEDGTESIASADPGETVLVSSSVNLGLVSEAKVTREQTRSKNKEILMELINSTNITEEQKQSAIDQMVSMTDIAERELAAETLLAAEGFDEVVVSINDAGADVVVSSTQVSDAQRAQIEDIVKRKTGIAAADITITPVTVEE